MKTCFVKTEILHTTVTNRMGTVVDKSVEIFQMYIQCFWAIHIHIQSYMYIHMF